MKRTLMLLLFVGVCAAQDAKPGRIFFYRLQRDTGKAQYSQPVLCDGQKIGILHRGKYFVFQPSEGKHTYRSSDDKTTLTLEAKPGETLYLMIDTAVGKFYVHAHPISVTADQARDQIAKLEYAKPEERPDDRILIHPPSQAER